MFGIYKRVKELEDELKRARELSALHTKIIHSLNEAVLSIDKRLNIHQSLYTSLAKQVDILAEHTLLKDYKIATKMVETKPNITAEKINENIGIDRDAPEPYVSGSSDSKGTDPQT